MEPSSALAEVAIKTSFVSVLRCGDVRVGGGILVDNSHVVTCAHVVALALEKDAMQSERPTEAVQVRLEFIDSAPLFTCVVSEWWPQTNQPSGSGVEDLAVLALGDQLPETAKPQPFVKQETFAQTDFTAFGYTRASPGGDWVNGKFSGPQPRGWVQMESGQSLHIDRGFSGGGVWSHQPHGFVGIVVTVDSSEQRKEIGYLLAAAKIAEAWSLCPIKPGIEPALATFLEHFRRSNADFLTSRGFTNGLVQFPLSVTDSHWKEIEPFPNLTVRNILEALHGLIRGQIIIGGAGSGKTSFLIGMVNAMIDLLLAGGSDTYVPVLVRFAFWRKEHSERLGKLASDTADSRMGAILEITDYSLQELHDWRSGRPLAFILDGLNEVDNERTRELIRRTLDEFLANNPSYRACITSRAAIEPGSRWETYKMSPIPKSDVESIFRQHCGDPQDLDEKTLELLGSPFFLSVAIRLKREARDPSLASPGRAIEGFYRQVVKFDGNGLDRMGTAAFNAYSVERSRSFSLERFEKEAQVQSGTAEYENLMSVIRLLPDGRCIFQHQLLHDFLVAWYFSRADRVARSAVWNRRGFDPATFDADSDDVLLMTMELLEDQSARDDFVRAIYDWNWRSAVTCLVDLGFANDTQVSADVRISILLIVAQKIQDPVRGARERARQEIQRLPDSSLRDKMLTGDNKVLEEIARSSGTQTEWFDRWLNLFSQTGQGLPSEEDLHTIADYDSILGWTAANTLKRFADAEVNLSSPLRAMYKAACGNEREVVRWRVVHTLGAFPSKQNVQFLLAALDDPYPWVGYGAARSLIEIAARTQDKEIRTKVIQELTDRAHSSRLQSRMVQVEIARTMFYRDVQDPASWISLVKPLLEAIRDIQVSEKARQGIEQYLDRLNSEWSIDANGQKTAP
jgi:hypothetical protein